MSEATFANTPGKRQDSAAKIFICPLPILWNEIYQKLDSAWKPKKEDFPPPPPLVLSGWHYSNDLEKKRRWEWTLKWAERNGLSALIPVITDDQAYFVSEISTYSVGPMGGPMYLAWDFTPKTRPEADLVEATLQKLEQEWPVIAGDELGAVTRPLRFSGKKLRRLLVGADPNHQPPWGSWTDRMPGEQRRAFTKFRQAVNDAIAPLMVDHIDFIVEGPL